MVTAVCRSAGQHKPGLRDSYDRGPSSAGAAGRRIEPTEPARQLIGMTADSP
jgi:hypothetical protein